MNKSVVYGVLLSGLLLSATASADVILGAQVGKQYLDVRQTSTTGAVSEDTASSNTSLGLIVGVGQPGVGGSRITAEWVSFGLGGSSDLDLLNFSYTYLLPSLASSSSLKLRPFVGAELGYGWLDVDSQPLLNGGDDSGLLLGARAGLNLAVSERAEIELGFRFSRVDLDATLNNKIPGGNAAHFEVENNKAWWLGFNIGL